MIVKEQSSSKTHAILPYLTIFKYVCVSPDLFYTLVAFTIMNANREVLAT